MKMLVKLDELSFKYLKAKNALELSCDDSKDDTFGTILFAMFREFEYEPFNITTLLEQYREERFEYTTYFVVSERKLRGLKRTEVHPKTLERFAKYIRKQVLNEYLCHMRVARLKYNQHREDAMYDFKKIYDLSEENISSESLLRFWSRKRHLYEHIQF